MTVNITASPVTPHRAPAVRRRMSGRAIIATTAVLLTATGGGVATAQLRQETWQDQLQPFVEARPTNPAITEIDCQAMRRQIVGEP